jgi:hypothetical protein
MGYPNTKPPAGAQINWGHPLAPDILALVINEGGSGGGLRDLVSGRVFSPSSANWRRVINQRGQAIEHTDITNYWDLGPIRTLESAGMSEVTVVMGYRKTDTTNRASAAFGLDNSRPFDVLLPFSDGKVYWDFASLSEGSGRVSVAGLTFGNDIWAFVAGARGREIWQNGALKASNTGVATLSSTSISMRLNTTANLNGDLAEVSFFYVYKRELPHSAIRRISAAPYSFLHQSA